MKPMTRIFFILLISLLVCALLWSACGKGEAPAATGGEEKPQTPTLREEFEMRTEGLETGETPVMILPDEPVRTFSGTGDGENKTFNLRNVTAPAEVTEVTVDGQIVTDYTYDPVIGELTFAEAPEKGAEIEVKAKDDPTPPPASQPEQPGQETPAPPASQPEVPAPTDPVPSWTGVPETPIIPYRPPATAEDDG